MLVQFVALFPFLPLLLACSALLSPVKVAVAARALPVGALVDLAPLLSSSNVPASAAASTPKLYFALALYVRSQNK